VNRRPVRTIRRCARGIKNRSDGGWNDPAIAHILQNRFYIGELRNAANWRSSCRSGSTPCRRCSRSSGRAASQMVKPTRWWTSYTAFAAHMPQPTKAKTSRAGLLTLAEGSALVRLTSYKPGRS
jgi:hypothetical protein